MKKLYTIGGMLAITLLSNAQNTINSTKKPEDEIRKYYFVLLHKGPNRDQDSATAAKIQANHLANIHRLYYAGKLKVAGPFGDDGDWQGLFIFDCPTQGEVDSLLRTDPAVAAGRLKYEIHSWYTSAIGSFVPGKPAQ